MNRKFTLLIILCVLCGVAYWLWSRSAPTSLDKPLSDFAIQDTASVSRIFITDQNGRTVDLRRNGQIWTLNGLYEAKQHDVALLLKTFKRVQVKSPVPRSSEATALRLMGAGARKVEISQGGDLPSKIWIVGHSTKDHFGTYMILEKPGVGRSSAPFIMDMAGFNGILNTRFHTSVDDWRTTKIFAYDDLRDVASMELRTPAAPSTDYRIDQLQDGRVRLSDGVGRPVPFDTILVKGALLPLKAVNYEAIERKMPPASRDSLLAAVPNHVLRITDRDGGVSTTKFWFMRFAGEEPAFGEPKPLHDQTRMHALVQDTLLVVMQRASTDRILQPISGFRP